MIGLMIGALLLGGMFYSWLALVRICKSLAERETVETNWQVNLVLGSFAWSILLVGVVELLSSIKAISGPALALAWAGLAAILFVSSKRFSKVEPLGDLFRQARKWELERPWLGWPKEVKYLVFGIAVIAFCLGGIALWTPPTDWQSLTFRLPRMMHWLQNGSVAPFPTNDLRQVAAGPWGEYLAMHLYLAGGGDRLVNLTQWIAMLLTLVSVTWLGGELLSGRLGRSGQLGNARDRSSMLRAGAWTAFLCLALPGGIVQSITTRMDYTVAWWFTAAVVCGILLARNPGSLVYAAGFGGALGLGLLTKSTMLWLAAVLVPVVGWFFALNTRTSTAGRAKSLGILILSFAVVVATHFARNYKLFGGPFGPGDIIPAPAGSNPSDIIISNVWHVLLILGAAVLLIARKWAPWREILWALAIAAAGVGVCSLFLSWTQVTAHFQLPFLLLFMPLAGIAITLYANYIIRYLMAAGLAVLAFFSSFHNEARPLLTESEFPLQPREQQYFLEAPHLHQPTLELAKDIIASGLHTVGFKLSTGNILTKTSLEYPLWVFLKNRGFEGKIFNVGVTNSTASLAATPEIEAVAASTGSVDPAGMPGLPRETSHGPYSVFWSEQASKWARLAVISLEGEQLVPAKGGMIPFAQSRCVLSCRVARPGVLTLRGIFLDADRPVLTPTAMALHSYAGFSVIKNSPNGVHLLDVALPPGETALKLETDYTGSGNLFFGDFQWEWLPTDESLPYAYLSRLASVEGPGPMRGDPYIIEYGDSRRLELVSGGSGWLDILLARVKGTASSLALSNDIINTNVLLATNITQVRVPVIRGTNLFELFLPEDNKNESLELRNIELRFRELAE